MTTINTYGLTIDMKSLTRAANDLTGWPKNSGGCTQIAYDTDSGEILLSDHVDGNSSTIWRDQSVVTVCYTSKKMSKQQIVDAVRDAIRPAEGADV